jgi:hypothetical protein
MAPCRKRSFDTSQALEVGMPAVWWCRTIKVNGGLVGEELAGRMALRLWYVSAPPKKKFFLSESSKFN